MATQQETQENRLRRFAGVFKGYMGVMPLITAALAPLLTMLKAIPVFDTQKTTLATFSGILGFLMVGWVFYMRRTIARGSTTRGARAIFNTLPFLLIVGSVSCYLAYFHFLDESLATPFAITDGVAKDGIKAFMLANMGKNEPIPYSTMLQLMYFGVFICAETAFVFMAMREYILDALRMSDVQWMFGNQDEPAMEQVFRKALNEKPPSEQPAGDKT